MRLSANFTTDEGRCRCGCGLGADAAEYPPEVVNLVQGMRDIKGGPLWVNSWFRCQRHNAAVGGVESSAHTRGTAVDLGVRFAPDRYDLILLAVLSALAQQVDLPQERWRALFYTTRAVLKGVGIAKSYVHVDTDSICPRPAAWGYGSDGGGA